MERQPPRLLTSFISVTVNQLALHAYSHPFNTHSSLAAALALLAFAFIRFILRFVLTSIEFVLYFYQVSCSVAHWKVRLLTGTIAYSGSSRPSTCVCSWKGTKGTSHVTAH